jgi:hypothetical protein
VLEGSFAPAGEVGCDQDDRGSALAAGPARTGGVASAAAATSTVPAPILPAANDERREARENIDRGGGNQA